jgi:hypothetical protein
LQARHARKDPLPGHTLAHGLDRSAHLRLVRWIDSTTSGRLKVEEPPETSLSIEYLPLARPEQLPDGIDLALDDIDKVTWRDRRDRKGSGWHELREVLSEGAMQ